MGSRVSPTTTGHSEPFHGSLRTLPSASSLFQSKSHLSTCIFTG